MPDRVAGIGGRAAESDAACACSGPGCQAPAVTPGARSGPDGAATGAAGASAVTARSVSSPDRPRITPSPSASTNAAATGTQRVPRTGRVGAAGGATASARVTTADAGRAATASGARSSSTPGAGASPAPAGGARRGTSVPFAARSLAAYLDGRGRPTSVSAIARAGSGEPAEGSPRGVGPGSAAARALASMTSARAARAAARRDSRSVERNRWRNRSRSTSSPCVIEPIRSDPLQSQNAACTTATPTSSHGEAIWTRTTAKSKNQGQVALTCLRGMLQCRPRTRSASP